MSYLKDRLMFYLPWKDGVSPFMALVPTLRFPVPLSAARKPYFESLLPSPVSASLNETLSSSIYFKRLSIFLNCF